VTFPALDEGHPRESSTLEASYRVYMEDGLEARDPVWRRTRRAGLDGGGQQWSRGALSCLLYWPAESSLKGESHTQHNTQMDAW
jgi:hypothetical protein